VKRYAQFEEERALRRSRDMLTQIEDQQGHDSGQKSEEVQSTES
jgi:hypothetical protein